jgi:hypothetical protein
MVEYFELFDSIFYYSLTIPMGIWLLYAKIILLCVVFYTLRTQNSENIADSNSLIYIYLFAVAGVYTVMPHTMSKERRD